MAVDIWGGVGQKKGNVIQPRGGGWIWTMQVNEDGTPLASPDTWHAGPYIKEINPADKSPFIEYETDAGVTLVTDGIRKVDTHWTTYQRNEEIYKAPIFTANGFFYAVLYQMSDRLINGVYQYRLWASCQFEAVSDIKHFGNDFPFHLWSNLIPSAVTYSTFTGVTTAKSSTFPVGASITVDPNVTGGGYWQDYTSIS